MAVPADVVKVRMQADGRLVASGKLAQPRYHGLMDGLLKIVRTEGVLGMWRGTGPAVQRAALVNLGELATYDQAKQLVIHTGLGSTDSVQTHALSAIASGLAATVCSSPADVIKTRLMNQSPSNPKFSSTLDCLRKTVQQEGVFALYKGFWPTWARLGPWQMCFWVSYEQLRKITGQAGF